MKFPGQKQPPKKSIDENIQDGNNFKYPTELLNDFDPPGFPPHELHLKKGAIIMCLRNIDHLSGVCNGTRLKVLRFTDYVIETEILTGPHKNEKFFVPRIKLVTEDRCPIPFVRRQFPVKLSFAMTINKAQGQTLDMVGLYLPEPVFSHGQLYVACGRVGSAEQLSIYVTNQQSQGIFKNHEGVYTKNVVYEEVLSRMSTASTATSNYNTLNSDEMSEMQHQTGSDQDDVEDQEDEKMEIDILPQAEPTDLVPICTCKKSLTYVRNNEREIDKYSAYWCDQCSRRLTTTEMIYHCSDYNNHEFDCCIYCAQDLKNVKKKRSDKEEMDASDFSD